MYRDSQTLSKVQFGLQIAMSGKWGEWDSMRTKIAENIEEDEQDISLS